MKRYFFFIFLFFGVLQLSYSQSYQESFGKNRIQYQNFEWSVINTDNFDIYYYPESKKAAIIAANYAENEFERVADFVGYAPFSRIKLIVYASHSDLLQSNIGLATQTVFVGGYKVFLKNRVEVEFNGVQSDFQKEITKGISQLILNEMYYGGSFKEVLQSTFFTSLPEWYLSGLVSYLANGWSTEEDDKIRDYFYKKRVRKPHNYSKEDAEIIGLSFWNYLIERFGKTAVQSYINETQSQKNYINAMETAFNQKYKQLIKDWRSYYFEQANAVKDTLKTPSKSLQILNSPFKIGDNFYGGLKLSPDGSRLAYVKNNKGKYKVIVMNLETGRSFTVYRGGYRTFDQKIKYDLPTLSWRNNDKIGVVVVRHDKLRLITYDIKKEIMNTKEWFKLEASNILNKIYTKKQTYRGIYKHFRQVNDFSFSDDGGTIVLSGENFLGQSDIYIYSLRTNNVIPITNDIFDDRSPMFLPKSTKDLVFSSNRMNDTLQPKKLNDFRRIQAKHDIFYVNTDSNKVLAKRITNTPNSNEILPKLNKDKDILFLSDQNGIYQLHTLDSIHKKPKPLTNFKYSLLSYDINDTKTSLAFILNIDGKRKFFLDTNFNANKTIDTLPKTIRQIMFDNTVYDYKTARELMPQVAKNQPINTRFELMQNRKKAQPIDSLEIDIDRYIFEFEKNEMNKRRNVISNSDNNNNENLTILRKKYVEVKLRFNEIYISSPVRYKNDFAIDRFTSTMRSDPLRGLGLQAFANLSDIMANHRLNAGFFGVFDFRTSIMFLEYEYLKKRVDFKVKYIKDALYWNPANIVHKYRTQKIEFTASYPFNPATRISFSPFFQNARFVNMNFFSSNQGLATPIVYTNYVGFNTEINFDNTRSKGLNMQEGTKLKVGYTTQTALNAARKDFSKFYVDVRNYVPIHRDLVLANRFSAGSFFGNAKKSFLLGGMDNWLFAGNDNVSANNPLNTTALQDNTDLLFNEYATNLRGFGYARLFGSNYFLWNSELRWPILKYLIRRQIKSNFLRNLQIAGFYDIGTAWTGQNPFTEQNSINTTTYQNGPFTAVVTNYTNPFLQGYGFGFRSMIQGTYTKIDVAWNEVDYVRSRFPKFYLTFGFDF